MVNQPYAGHQRKINSKAERDFLPGPATDNAYQHNNPFSLVESVDYQPESARRQQELLLHEHAMLIRAQNSL